MRAVIVGSGPSAKGFKPPAGVIVIAVNGAVDWLPSPVHYWFTLDASHANLQRMRYPRAGTQYCAAVPADHEPLPPSVRRYERLALRGQEPEQRGTAQWWLWRWSAVRTLSEVPGVIHTGNSAWGALGLAYQLGAEKVALVGVDATDDERLEGGRPNNLSHLPLLFESAMGQVAMVNCGRMRSRIRSLSITEGMRWLVD